MPSTELARAKVNLFLHVGRPGADGYHDISSLMVFADVGDRVTLTPAGSGFSVTGKFADGLAGEADNLVTRARDLFLRRFGAERAIGLTLDKALPIAAGLGGGSADAAAALRLLADAWRLPEEDCAESGALGEIARALGADVAACLRSASVMAEGRGDILNSAPTLPVLHAVLVNPNLPSPTGATYSAFDDARAWAALAAPAPAALTTVTDVVTWLAATRNDLETAAIQLCPEIGAVIAELRRSPDCLMARMSGSGATCFALCAGETEAKSLAASVARARPGWWAKPCRFGDNDGALYRAESRGEPPQRKKNQFRY